MLEQPDISDATVIACLHERFGLRVAAVTFLPLGWVNNALYRVVAEGGTSYVLKLRRGNFNEAAVAVPAFLHARGIRQIVAPIPTTSSAWWVRAHGVVWTLYPFVDGKTGFEMAFSQRHWIALGQSMQAVHTTKLPASLAERVPQEDFSPRWRTQVRTYDNRVQQNRSADPIAARLAAFWLAKRGEILAMVDRADQLALALQQRPIEFVVCHSDLHARNVLIGADGEVAIVDWDEPILAPKERDLMFIGGGVGGIWNTDHEAAWFYQGYGRAKINVAALSYYRYERILTDIAECAEQIFHLQGVSKSDRKHWGSSINFYRTTWWTSPTGHTTNSEGAWRLPEPDVEPRRLPSLAPGYADLVGAWVGEVTSGRRPNADAPTPPRQDWPSVAVQPSAWWEAAWMQLAAVALLMVAFAGYPLVALVRRMRGRSLLALGSRPARLLAGMGAGAVLGLFVYVPYLLIGNAKDAVPGPVLAGRPLMWLLLQALALTAVGASVATAVAWRQAGGSMSRGERLRLGLLLAGGVVFVPWALYWGLLLP